MYCTVPKGPLRASTSFLAGKFFLCFFFSWIAWGNLQQQRKSVLVLFISVFFGGGVFGTAAEPAAAGFYLALSFSLSLFRGRASLEEGLEDGREERKAV